MIDRGLLIQNDDDTLQLQSDFTRNAVSSGATLWGALESTKQDDETHEAGFSKTQLREIADQHDVPDDAFEDALDRCLEYGVVYEVGDGYEIMEI
ncbi:hypothetical protein HARCEL1_12125 [Halococcoides cellulosivorans]|uniref:Uncharacterized protein n=2 Tax=Halococcoides cellulosivorans TaxID=1679096 RepID=A0A2R4X3M0_9EURY|nr:hypothetical protein HARCEL1_12125 [Halococcoides cellulosivorans]